MTTRFLLLSLFLHLISPRAGTSSGIGRLETTFLQTDTNSVISPYSIASTLLPLKLGSDGKTRLELEKALEGFEFGNSQKVRNEKSSISSTTLLLTAKDIELLPDYRRALNGINVDSIEGFDFRDFQFINDYVKNSTGGLIQDIVSEKSFSKDTKMVIVNGVYFESTWRTPFQAILRNMRFTSSSGSTTEVPMMFQKSSNYYGKLNDLGATVLELPYKSLDKVMRIYLPFTATGLPELLKNLKNFNTSALRLKLTELEVYLPKLKIENQIRLTSGLEELGLRSLTRTTADFRKISNKPLRVDEIISKSVIEVTQSGTKAGSATAVFIIPLSGFTAEEFIADRPFYFEIRGIESNNVYFSGTYTNPDPLGVIGQLNSEAAIVNRENIPTGSEIVLNPTVDAPWWIHTGRPEYLLVPQQPNPEESTPRFQQPEPIFPSGIRFLYPSKDPNGQYVIDSHLKNVSSINAV